MATIPVSWGELDRPGSHRFCDRQNASFFDPWFLVSTVRMTGCESPHAPLLIFPSSGVIRSGLRADVNVLCDLAERLSGLFIMACMVNSRGDILHNVTLPRSWFVNLISPGTDLRKDTSTFSMFAETMIELMQKIDAQAQQYRTSLPESEQFIADGSRMTDFTGSLYIARM